MDMLSLVIGKELGHKEVTVESDSLEFLDADNDGNVVIQEGE